MKNLLLSITVLTVLSLVSCDKTTDPIVNPVVYVAGYESNGTHNVAKYWVDGTPIGLPGGTKESVANSIFVEGTDVYVAGYINNGTHNVAVYWKNGAINTLTTGTDPTVATSIFVQKTNFQDVPFNVYVAGYQGNVAVYWKNGDIYPLPVGTTPTRANSIVIDQFNNMYIAADEQFATDPYFASWKAFYYQNGVEVEHSLVNGNEISNAASVAVYGGDFYIAGNKSPATNDIIEGAGRYWKNGAETILQKTKNTNTGLLATGIAVNANGVYVSGYENNNGDGLNTPNISTAKYWLNGTATSLTDGKNNAYAYAIAVNGTDVYVAGVETPLGSSYSVAKYWKNGTEEKALTYGTTNAYATSIFLK